MIQIRKFRKGGLRKLEKITMLETQVSHMLNEIKIYFMKKIKKTKIKNCKFIKLISKGSKN